MTAEAHNSLLTGKVTLTLDDIRNYIAWKKERTSNLSAALYPSQNPNARRKPWMESCTQSGHRSGHWTENTE